MKRISRFTNYEISQIFKTARRALRHPGLDILCTPAAQDTARILVITSGKTGNSPQRNLVRRRLKSIFYENKFYELGFDCIVIMKKPGIDLSFEELTTLLTSALDRMR
jgi:ribonuclease P protein component